MGKTVTARAETRHLTPGDGANLISWGEYPIPLTQPAGYLFTPTSKTNINPEITYEYEYGITAGGRTKQDAVSETHFQLSISHTGHGPGGGGTPGSPCKRGNDGLHGGPRLYAGGRPGRYDRGEAGRTGCPKREARRCQGVRPEDG